MTFSKKIFFTISMVFIGTLSIVAQTEKSLLWQITGNGLQQPSYLFGTIHITDKRVFDLPDSVLAKMKQCDAAIFELNLDSLSSELMHQATQRGGKTIRELLTDKELKKLNEALVKNKIADEEDIGDQEPMKLYSKYQEKLYKNKDMTTFLDAYLYGIAKLYDKEVSGLETYAEQKSALLNLKDEEQRKMLMSIADTSIHPEQFIDSLINLYHKQDLNMIYKLLVTVSDVAFEDVILIKRNYVMEHRIDSLLKSQSLFISVGAGHLPGKEGLISLLRKRGYSVTAMISPNTGYYKTLLPDENAAAWKPFTDDNGGYKISMPGTPTNMSMMGLDMKGYYDFGSGYFYLATGIPMTENKKDAKKVMEDMVKSFEKKGTVTGKKPVKYKDFEGYDVTMILNQKQNYTVRILSKNTNAYLLMIGVSSKEPDTKLTEKYFNSLEPMERIVKGNSYFTDDTAAFKMLMPPNFKLGDHNEEESARYKTYTCFDFNTTALFSVTYADYKPGLYFDDLNALFESAFEDVQKAVEKTPEFVIDTTLSGYSTRYYKIVASDKSYMHVKYVMRNCRLYVILAASKNIQKEAEILQLFNTFDFIPTIPKKYDRYISPQKDFSLLMPGVVILEADTIDEDPTNITYEYTSSDRSDGSWIQLQENIFNDFTYFKNDSSFISSIYELHKAETDSIVDTSSVYENGKLTHSFKLLSSKNPLLIRNYKVVLNGKRYYILVTPSSLNEPLDSSAQTILNSFKILKADKSFSIFSSKKEALLTAIHSADTIVQKAAMLEFKKYDFEKPDVTSLEATLLKPFPDDSSLGRNTRFNVYSKIYDLTDSTELVSYIIKHYNEMPVDGYIRIDALRQLANSNSEISLAAWKKFILGKRPMPKYPYEVSSTAGLLIYDSVPLLTTLFPEIFQLIDDTLYKRVVYSLTSVALQYKNINPGLCSAYTDILIKEAQTEYDKILNPAPEEENGYYYSPTFEDVINILGELPPNEKTTELFTNILNDSVYDDKNTAILFLVKNNLPVNKKALLHYLKTPYHRNSIYDKLQEINRTDAYPKELKDQKYFAEGDIFSVCQYDDFYPEKVELIEVRKATYEGNKQRFYLYKVIDSDEAATVYFGLAGPYPDDKNVHTYGTLTGLNYEEFKTKSLDEHFKSFFETPQSEE